MTSSFVRSCPDASFEWTIQATSSNGVEAYTTAAAAATAATNTLVGRAVTFKALGVGEHTVKLTVTHPLDGSTAQLESTVRSK